MAPGVTTHHHLYVGLRELRGLNRAKMPERRRGRGAEPENPDREYISGGDGDGDDDGAGG